MALLHLFLPLRCHRSPFSALRSLLVAAVVLGFVDGVVDSYQASAADLRPTEFRLVASPEPDWPQWRGPRRDGISDETGLLDRWPKGGPPRLWSAGDLGRGYSAPIVVGNRIFLTGEVGSELHLLALDLSGRRLWTATNGLAWKGPYPGARACPTYSEGHLYHLNAHGRVACLEAGTGHEVWAIRALDRFGGKNITWALSECLLVDGDQVIVTVGGAEALMVALDKKTGRTLWQSEPLILGASSGPADQRLSTPVGEVDAASYASPILITDGRQRQIINCSLRHAFGVDADTGKLLWAQPLVTRHNVIAATPVLCERGVFVTAPDAGGGRLLNLADRGDLRPGQPVWTTLLDTCHGCVVRVEDRLYGSWYRERKGWACLDAQTGEVLYETQDLAMGSIRYADGLFYCLGQDGEMALLRPAEDHFEFAGRLQLVDRKVKDAWTHPVIHARKLYLRYHEDLWCHDIAAR